MQTFAHTGAIETWNVPETGTWQILATGAQGGGFSGSPLNLTGGRGARMGGLFDLTAGTAIRVAVGGRGQTVDDIGGGGGGSFVVLPGASPAGDVPLVVAGGGGGIGSNAQERSDASTGPAGQRGSPVDFFVPGTGGDLPGPTGEGGPTNSGSPGGGGGGGWNSDGEDADLMRVLGFSVVLATGGASWFNGLAGGLSLSGGANGGFGGGGGVGGSSPGGGGGWSGGQAGTVAGGGGSYFNSTLGFGTAAFPLIAEAGAGLGDGAVTFSILREDTTTAVPEPAGLALFGLALAGLAALRPRKPAERPVA